MYKDAVVNSINQIIDEINKRKEGSDSAAATYRDTPLLKQFNELIESGFDEEKDSLLIAFNGYLFLSEQYTSLGRLSISADYLFKALLIAAALWNKYSINLNETSEVVYRLLRDRNFYVDDDCDDVLEILKKTPLLDQKSMEEMFQARMKRRRNLKNDPVEMSKEYLDVIDEVEEKIEKNRKSFGMGSCHEYWELKERFLLEKGIKWRSPAILNPRVLFD